MSETNRPYMMISVSRRNYPAVSDMLEVFIKHGQLKRENCVMDYNSDDMMYTFEIGGVRFEAATFIGDILEAGIGQDLEWMHCQFDEENGEE